MAEVMLEMGNSMMVPHCCARALDIYRKTGDRLGEADAYRLLGRTFGLRKDWATGEESFGTGFLPGSETLQHVWFSTNQTTRKFLSILIR